MNNNKSCDSEHIAEEKNNALEDLEWNNCKSHDSEHVNALLDISEELTFKEQDPYEVQIQGWEEAIQGWGRSAPLAFLVQAQSRGRKVKPDVIEPHCLLCSDLKDLKVSEPLVSDCAGTSSESSCAIAEEPFKNVIPTSLELPKRAPSNSSSSSFSEEETSDCSSQDKHIKPDPLGNKLLFGDEQYIHNKTLPHHLQPNGPCPFLKDRGAGKVALIGNLIVLPPVKPSTPANSRSPIVLKRREARVMCPPKVEAHSVAVCGATGQVTVGDKVTIDEDRDKAVVAICQESLNSKHESGQHQYHLLSIAVSKKAHLPFSTLGDTLPHATSLMGRNLRQEELTRSPLRQNSGHRPHLGFKAKSMRRAEPELPMLLGTRVAIPVSAQRLL